jgi:hypothetical protein
MSSRHRGGIITTGTSSGFRSTTTERSAGASRRTLLRHARLLAVLGAALVALSGAAQNALAARGLTLGFSSDPNLTSGSAGDTVWINRAVVAGARAVRVNVNWAAVAPTTRPAGFNPSSPASGGYNWTSLDRSVTELAGHGIKVVLTIYDAPAWAEGPNPPPHFQPGTWRPSPSQLAAFATAAARRYDGRYPNPASPGTSLPRVSDWQGWDEPNLDFYLTPQWTRSAGKWQPASPAIYAAMQNAFYAAVKKVSRSNYVIMGGTAPFGDPPGGQRMQPVAFYRTLFCLRGAKALTPTSCPDRVHFDAVDHHPYSISGPLWHAGNADDVSIPDMYKITRVLGAAERAHHVLPVGKKSVWATEIEWDTNPPDPHGVPIQRQARWLEQALYVLWNQGVSTVMWLQLVDAPPVPNYASTYQGGLYLLSGKAKPALTAYRFPFVVTKLGHGRVRAWGRSPSSGTLAIERSARSGWTVIRRMRARAYQVFEVTLPVKGRTSLRATVRGSTSLTWP